MLTGRCHDFDTLRKKGGLSGYPCRRERSRLGGVQPRLFGTVLRRRAGKGIRADRHRNRHVVAVVGDGALTGGMCWEALNNIAAARRPVVIVVNDNGRSYAPTIGGFADHLAARGRSRATRSCWRRAASRCGHAGHRRALLPVHAQRQGRPQGRAVPAGDVHRPRTQIRRTDRRPRRVRGGGRAAPCAGFNAPVIVHVVTRKGMGYAPAENDEAEQMHSTGVIDPRTGLATKIAGPGWTSAFSEALINYGPNAATSWRSPRPCPAPRG